MRRRLGGGEGTSYPAVLGYFAERIAPSVVWCEHAADELGVRSAWLTLGDGAPTKAVEDLRIEPARWLTTYFEKRVSEVFGAPPEDFVSVAFMYLCQYTLFAELSGDDDVRARMGSRLPEIAAKYADLILAPIGLWLWEHVEGRRVNEYLGGSISNLRLLVPERGTFAASSPTNGD